MNKFIFAIFVLIAFVGFTTAIDECRDTLAASCKAAYGTCDKATSTSWCRCLESYGNCLDDVKCDIASNERFQEYYNDCTSNNCGNCRQPDSESNSASSVAAGLILTGAAAYAAL